MEICRKKLKPIIKIMLSVIHATIYAVILTMKNHTLYYTETSFSIVNNFPIYAHTNGIFHHLLVILTIFYIIFGFIVLLMQLRKEKSKFARNRLIIFILAMLSEAIFYIIQILGKIKLTAIYDFTMIGFSIGTIFMFIAIFKYNLLSTKELAQNFMLDRISEPIIAIDSDNIVQYFNMSAKKIYSNLKISSSRIPFEITKAALSDNSIKINKHIYTIKENELIHNNEILGKIFVFVDDTKNHHIQENLIQKISKQNEKLDKLSHEIMIALSKTVDAKNHYTNGHSKRVAEYSAEISRRMGKSFVEQEKIYELGLMHEIGKIGISEDILNKTSRLTDDEFNKIREHTVIGYDILSSITEMPDLAIGARSHHERYDGKGYPDGLAGKDIPEAARIICIADCYDAMTSIRTYSTIRSQTDVRAEIEKGCGTQFNPDIAKIMLQMIDDDTEYKMNEQVNIKIWKAI